MEITRDIDIEMAARLAEVRLEDFKALNPSQRKPIIFAAGTPQVLLPWDNAATFKKNLSAADPTTLASWTAWVAPATMPTREAAQRVHMDEDDLRQLNGVPNITPILRALGSLLAESAPFEPMAAVDAWVAAPDDTNRPMPA